MLEGNSASKMGKPIIWKTVKTWVDIETGEELTVKQVKENYCVESYTKDSRIQGIDGVKYIRANCRRTNQGKLL